MPHIRPDLPPGGVGSAIGKFDEVQGVLNVRIQLVQGHELPCIELAGHAAPQDRQGFCLQVLRKLKVLEKPEAEALVVIRGQPVVEFRVPAVDKCLAVCDRAHGFFPLVPARERAALHDTAARET